MVFQLLLQDVQTAVLVLERRQDVTRKILIILLAVSELTFF